MNLQEQLAADQQALADAQAKQAADAAANQALVDAAAAKVAQDQTAIANIQPHLDLLDQAEALLTRAEDGLTADFAAALDAFKQQITPLISQMRALLTNA